MGGGFLNEKLTYNIGAFLVTNLTFNMGGGPF